MHKGAINMEFSQLVGKTFTKIEKVIEGSFIEELFLVQQMSGFACITIKIVVNLFILKTL